MKKTALAIAITIALLGMVWAQPASAYQLAPNANIHRILSPGGATTDASYGTYGVPYAKQALRGYGIMNEYSLIQLVFYNPFWGTLNNVTCQQGYTGPSYEPGGWCQWTPEPNNGIGAGVEQATYPGGTAYTGFGMRVQSRVYWAGTQYNDNRMYSAVG